MRSILSGLLAGRSRRRRLVGSEQLETRTLLSAATLVSGTQQVESIDVLSTPTDNEFAYFNRATGRWHVGSVDNWTMSHELGPRWEAWSTVQTFTGDINGDGLTDLLGRRHDNGQWWGGIQQPDGSFITQFMGAWQVSTYDDVALGDFNGDGLDDAVGRTADGRWFVGISDGNRFNFQYAGRWGDVSWADVFTGDFNGDGRLDIAGRQATGHWWFALSDGTRFVNSYAGRWTAGGYGWTRIMVGDFNGDGRTDVAGFSFGNWWEGLSTGTKIETHWAGRLWDPTVRYESFQVGDFDGDGRDDIAVGTSNAWYVTNVHNARGHYAQTYWGSRESTNPPPLSFVRDINGDGRDDIVGLTRATGVWNALESDGTAFIHHSLGTWPGTDYRLIL
ncbi:MAG: VCBS repeat-containing protein [Planctomycetaceae bacterium]|nr:VCBS repeat-containing protein [Planctomycetaceae bacterium]